MDDEAILVHEDDVRLDGSPQTRPALLRHNPFHRLLIQELPLAGPLIESEARVEPVAPW
jgi:hypothetical protein